MCVAVRSTVNCLPQGSGFFGGDHLLASPPGFSCCALLLSDGYAVAQVEHRGSRDGGVFPAAVHDVKAAVRFLRRLANKEGPGPGARLDPNRIAAWGASSGGYFAAMLAVTSGRADTFLDGIDSDDEDGTVSADICCAVDYFGPTDFLQMDTHSEREKGHNLVHDAPDSPEGCFMGCAIYRFDHSASQ